jgi:hypothetical protein
MDGPRQQNLYLIGVTTLISQIPLANESNEIFSEAVHLHEMDGSVLKSPFATLGGSPHAQKPGKPVNHAHRSRM